MLGIDDQSGNQPGLSLDEIRAFLKASEAGHFEGEKKEEVYAWVSGCLGEQKWDELGRSARLVRRYLEKMTGLSRAQITRPIPGMGRMARCGLSAAGATASRCGTATRTWRCWRAWIRRTRRSAGRPRRRFCKRQCYDFGDRHYVRLARISVAQIDRLRKSAGYRKQRVVYQCTRAVQVAIGQRRARQPEEWPGYLIINHIVAKLLNKLLIEQTKSRPRHCNDNALVECKNGAVIRKHIRVWRGT